MSFQANPNHQPSRSFEPIPSGNYSLVCTEAEWKTSSTGNRYINARLDVTGPAYQGRVIWWRCMLGHPNATTHEIAFDQMNGFCLSAGLAGWEDPSELVGCTVEAKIGLGKKQEGYDQQNEVKAFIIPDVPRTAAPATQQPVTQRAATPPPASKPRPTWT